MTDLGIDVWALLVDLGIALQIVVIDLMLSADNALVIALACRGLPPGQMRRATLVGTAGAIVLRVAMAATALLLLQVPFVKLVAGLTLLLIAIRLTLDGGEAADLSRADDPGEHWLRRLLRDPMLGAIATIVAADAVMSLDNVVAVAAVANGSLVLLALGLALSIPMLVYGSTLIRGVIGQSGTLLLLAGMFLGWLAGGIAVSDTAVAGWVAANGPALVVAVPLAGAVFVFWQNRIFAGVRPAPDPAATGGPLDVG